MRQDRQRNPLWYGATPMTTLTLPNEIDPAEAVEIQRN
jgi:hypothetical protein